MPSTKIRFKNKQGIELVGKLEFPLTKKPDAYAIFAHVFTGNKNITSARNISRALNLNGIALLRFDFTGLGESGGDFANSNFSTNVDDVIAAAKYLEEHYEAPKIIIGHSLGGAAAVFAAKQLDSVHAVATIGSPSTPEHVTHLFGASLSEIKTQGFSNVLIGGREFKITRQLVEDLQAKDMHTIVHDLDKAILILHSPQDQVVEIDNAAKIYHAALHPKSFITLDGADHMLSNKDDAFYTGNVVASWVKRYIDMPDKQVLTTQKQVVAKLEKEGYTTEIMAGKHGLIADESEDLGGNDFGPSPYELLNSALAACTVMTLQMYARRKNWPLEEVKVHISFDRSYKEDCIDCEDDQKRIGLFDLELELKGDLTEEQKLRLAEIANRCPVHKTIAKTPEFNTIIRDL